MVNIALQAQSFTECPAEAFLIQDKLANLLMLTVCRGLLIFRMSGSIRLSIWILNMLIQIFIALLRLQVDLI
jgi:hypothetical protein